MEVSQVIKLTEWFNLHTKDVEPKYTTLVNVLQNNAQQPNQQPVIEPLKDLSRTLAAMPTQELSSLQMRVLGDMGVANLIGRHGKEWLNQKVRSTTFDPATTFQTVQEANQRIAEAKRKLNEFRNAAATVGFKDGEVIDAPTPYVINVIFQDGAAIENVRDWKKTAADWELIISGVAGVVGEKPEEIKVIGASSGSIIFTLSATALVTKILATISKYIASIANDYLDFQIKREELRKSRMMSDAIEADLTRQEEERRAKGKSEIINAVKELVPGATPESLSRLEKSIDKQIAFGESGGEVDFVTPATLDENAEDYDDDLATTIHEIRQSIEDYRTERQQTKLLTNDAKDDEDPDDE